MGHDRTKEPRSWSSARLKASTMPRTSGGRDRAMWNIARLSLWPIAVALSGNANAAEVRHACDAKVFQPCPSFSAKVTVKGKRGGRGTRLSG